MPKPRIEEQKSIDQKSFVTELNRQIPSGLLALTPLGQLLKKELERRSSAKIRRILDALKQNQSITIPTFVAAIRERLESEFDSNFRSSGTTKLEMFFEQIERGESPVNGIFNLDSIEGIRDEDFPYQARFGKSYQD